MENENTKTTELESRIAELEENVRKLMVHCHLPSGKFKDIGGIEISPARNLETPVAPVDLSPAYGATGKRVR